MATRSAAPFTQPAGGWLTAAAVGVAAFALYRSTMLPGMDLGDTPSFQVMGGSTAIGPRDGYPLYFAFAAPFVWWSGGDAARALNLASVVAAALACGLLVLLTIEISGSRPAAACASMLFAGSYTFWSQAIIAEVYALHLALVVLTLLALLAWSRRGGLWRLAIFFAVYAVAFGNHLTMILLAPGVLIYLFLSAPGGARSLLAPRVLLIAAVTAGVGASQYLWNLGTLLHDPVPPRTLFETLDAFWFDVTKSDWRDTMLGQVPGVMAGDRLRMYAFDLHQQFGWLGLGLAAIGLPGLAADRGRALLLFVIYASVLGFALTYNVGDTHVFLLPSHLLVAVAIATGIAGAAGWAKSRYRYGDHVIIGLAAAIVVSRLWSEYPALDRSEDRRPEAAIARLTDGLDDAHAVLLSDLNWQLENGLTYFAKRIRPDVAFAHMNEVVLYAPTLIRDNLAIGRDVVLTEGARATLAAAYGPLFTPSRDSRLEERPLREVVAELAPGTRYVLCVLKPLREFVLDGTDLGAAVTQLTGGHTTSMATDGYAVVAGLAGSAPALATAAGRPFRTSVTLGGVGVEVRMESWLNFDTIRRMGFAQVVAARRHSLIAERGISFVAIDEHGRPLRVGYAAGVFAPGGRYLIPAVR